MDGEPRNKKYCCDRCATKYHNDRRPKRGRITECAVCGGPIETPRVGKRYCGPLCKGRAQNKTYKKILKDCRYCGKSMGMVKGNRMYCGEPCRDSWLLEKRLMAFAQELGNRVPAIPHPPHWGFATTEVYKKPLGRVSQVFKGAL